MKYSDYNERKVHGTATFPIEYYYIDQKSGQYLMPLHWHSEFEIVRAIKGEVDIFLNNEHFVLTSGETIFINGGVLHRAEPHDCIYECAVFNVNMLRKHHNDAGDFFLPILNGNSGVSSKVFKNDSEVKTAIESLFTAISKREDFFELEVFSALFSIFHLLYKNGEIVSLNKQKGSLKKLHTLSTLLDWIEENFVSEISLKDLSEVSNLSEKYICRIFKEYTLQTPIEYINRLRVDFAAHEMLIKKVSVTQAAFDSGFNDLSYFSKTFKKYKGISPHVFMKKH